MASPKIFTSRSLGKVILSGEHSAVYGKPAVAASIDLYLEAQLQKPDGDTTPQNIAPRLSPFVQNLVLLFQDRYKQDLKNISIKITGDLPVGSGLGSSAAAAYAVFQTLAQNAQLSLSDEDFITLIQASERFAHGHPSGLDATTVVKKGVIQFQRHEESFTFGALPTRAIQNIPFFLIQSGHPFESTKVMIEKVKEKQRTSAGKDTIAALGKITTQVIKALETNTFSFAWMHDNEQYLEELGIAGAEAQTMIEQIEKLGGFAKVTGGGGWSDGSGMILAHHDDTEKLTQFLMQQNWPYYQSYLGRR